MPSAVIVELGKSVHYLIASTHSIHDSLTSSSYKLNESTLLGLNYLHVTTQSPVYEKCPVFILWAGPLCPN